MSKIDKINIPTEAGPKYRLINEIKDSPLYQDSNHDEYARKFLAKKLKSSGIGHVVPGQLILFNYFEPKTKDQLEYYDATPCTIFFGIFNSSQGKRILGFNIHYYPLKMRFQIMSRIFDIYKPIYSKYFTEPLTKDIDAFDYKYLVGALKKAKLDFGVREYIPELCSKAWRVPANMWQVAVFTEGRFKKQTQRAIINHWENWRSGVKTNSKAFRQKMQKKENFLQRILSRFKKKFKDKKNKDKNNGK